MRASILLLLTVAGAGFMTGLDSTIVLTAIPRIAESFGESPLRLGIAISAYLLSLAVFTPASGWTSARFGARNVYAAAILVFLAGSILCGLSDTLAMMVAGRLMQGAGGALMGVVGQIALLHHFRKDQLIRATSFTVVASQIGPLVAPLIGGYLATFLSWRWIFYINIPIGIAELALAWMSIDTAKATEHSRFDFAGFLMLALGLCALQLATDDGARSAFPRGVGWVFGAFAAAMLLSYWRHAQSHPEPLLDGHLMGLRVYAISLLAGSVSIIGITAVSFLLPLLFQLGFGLNPVESGVRSFVVTVGVLGLRGAQPMALRRLGFRQLLIGNTVWLALSIIGFALMRSDTPLWMLILYTFQFGCSRSFHWSTCNALGYVDLHPRIIGRAAAMTALANQLAQSVGIGISATLVATLAGARQITALDIRISFCIVGLITLGSLAGFLRLRPDDGQSVSNHRVAIPLR